MKIWIQGVASVLLIIQLLGCSSTPTTPESTQPARESASLIPELEAQEIITYYEHQGLAFKTEYMEDKNSFSGQKYDPYAKVTYFCYIHADKTNKVKSIKYIVNGTDHAKAEVDEFTKNYFGYSAGRTYKAANAEQAQEWVKQNVPAASKEGAAISTQIGEVVFELSGTPEVRTLLVHAPKQL